ncbi:sensor domain-containing diguanylate cyclase/phosphohydrolase [Acetobacterium malicum]|uniref:sensor domain-containing diguanylate cyclase/phosphohydrolase n=1 Tax=Acetobacterium malicum TaxID=52692 RepID=UPI0003FACF07|nr:diguanylate cyclase [Acetobacterium dehalogenans]
MKLTALNIAIILIILFLFGLGLYFILKRGRKRKKEREIRRFNELVQTFIESEEIPVSLKDDQLNYIFVNLAMEDFYGISSEEIIGQDDFEILDEKMAIKERKTDKKVLATKTFVTDEMLWKGKIFKTTKFPVDLLNGKFGVGAYVRSASEKNREKYLKTLMSISDGVMIVDPMGKIEMLNSTAEEMTGWTAREAMGKHYSQVFVLEHEKDSGVVPDPIEEAFKDNTLHEFDSQAVLLARDGRKYHLEESVAPISDDEGHIDGAIVIFRDVTEKKEKRAAIEYNSFHDSLTGLYNRRFFEEELVRLDTERNLPLSVIIGDVDGLKLTNDIFGHEAGDELIKKVSEIFRKVCRADDIIARWGGDEFAILLPQTEKKDAQKLSERIKDNFSKEKIKSIQGNVSLGVATKYEPEENIEVIIASAEDNMYMKKTLNRGKKKEDAFNIILDKLYGEYPAEAEHARKTSEICKKIARKMKLSEAEINKVSKAAYLHDIGKVALDKEVASKNEYMIDDTYKEMKMHPVVGYRILNAFDHTIDLANIVMGHHERWDGTGYPQGLKGKETPKLSRIIAVGERFDDMTTDKDYRQAISIDDALDEMKRNVGTHYDPEVVEALEKVIAEENTYTTKITRER